MWKGNQVMNIAIFGSKQEAISFYQKLKGDINNKVVCFVDNNKKKVGKFVENIPICSVEQLRAMYPRQVDTIILALRNGHSIASIIEQLRKENIENIGLLKPAVYDFKEEIDISQNSLQFMWLNKGKTEKPLLTYLQVILIKTCNFNCKGCGHYANLFNKMPESHNIYEIGDFKRDIKLISENTEVFRLRMLGGEPLLYPYLIESLEFTRECFPNSDIRLVTNGVLLLKASAELLQCIFENKIGLDISVYKPTYKVKNEIIARLDAFNIRYDFEGLEEGYIEAFRKNVSLNKINNPQKSFEECPDKQCLTLMQGKLYKCPFEAFSYKFFDYFNISNPCKYGYDIHEERIDWKEQINKMQLFSADACKYCSETIESFEWDMSLDPASSDWAVD